MKNRVLICPLLGFGSWGLFILSMLTMNFFSRWIAFGLALLWVASSVAGVVVSLTFRFRFGTRRNGAIRWGMIVSVLMTAVQIFLFLLSFLQQKNLWDSSAVGAISGGLSLAAVVVLAILYRFLAHRGQTRIESAPGETVM